MTPDAPHNKRTPLYDLHLSLGGRMTPFAGYDMPVQYDGMGILKEHLHTRALAGIFDVSHMGQAFLKSADGDPAATLETVVPGDIRGLRPGRQRYTVLLNDAGGIVDDLMVARVDAHTLFLVVNAACKEKDFAYLRARAGNGAELFPIEDRALIALQGPAAADVLTALIPSVGDMSFMDVAPATWNGQALDISRSGYTGEDGFEVSLPASAARSFAETLLKDDRTRMIGLGARDSLRLEAGLCLYGQDIDESTTPIEAGLAWVIGKRRREEGGFAGAARLEEQRAQGPARRRVGLRPEGRAPLRPGTEIQSAEGRTVGRVTSGGFGPTVGAPVAMGYVETDVAATGTALVALVRGQALACKVVDLPFTPHHYKTA